MFGSQLGTSPRVTDVIDIGGQAGKHLKIPNGALDTIAVNEAHSSSARGSLLQTFAETKIRRGKLRGGAWHDEYTPASHLAQA